MSPRALIPVPVLLAVLAGLPVALHRTTLGTAWFPGQGRSRGAEERVVVLCHSAPGAGILDPDSGQPTCWPL